MFAAARDPVGEAETLGEVGLLRRKKGELGRPESEDYELALSAVEGLDDIEAKRIKAKLLGRLGKSVERAGADAEAILKYHKEAVRLAREVNDPALLAARLGRLAATYRDSGRFEEALALQEEAVEICRREGNVSRLANQLSGLARIYGDMGNRHRAKYLYLQADQMTAKGDIYGKLDRLTALGRIHCVLHELPEAERYYLEALELARTVNSKKAESECLQGLGTVYRLQENQEKEESSKRTLLDSALKSHKAAVEIQEKVEGDLRGTANRFQEMGRTLVALGNYSEAKQAFCKSLRVARKAKLRHLEAWQFMRLAEALDSLNQLEDSAICFQKAVELFDKGSEKRRGLEKKAKVTARMDEVARTRVDDRLHSLDEEIERIMDRECRSLSD